MSERGLRPANVAAAAAVLGALLALVMPRHAPSIVRVVVATVGVAALVHALAVVVPRGSVTGWWRSPFEPERGRRAVRPSHELDRIRSRLSGRRSRMGEAPSLPPETVRLLQSLARTALERADVDPADAASALSPLTRAVLAADPGRASAWPWTLWPDPCRVAGVVHGVLDDLDRLVDPAPIPTSPDDAHEAPGPDVRSPFAPPTSRGP